MYNPLVSIIIPVYNGNNYLKESIDSALAQTYKNIEVIVVNDGSTDLGQTEKIALSYGKKIRYFYKENGGVATALDYGIDKMNGEWFSWLSHDDLYMPNKVESQIKKIIEEKLDVNNTIVSCRNILIDKNGKKIHHPQKFKLGLFQGREMFKNLFNGMNLNGCSLLIPRILLQELGGFNKEYRFIQDWVCWVEMALRNNKFYLYDEKLVKSRIHENQDTIKMAKIQPIEINKYLSELFNQLCINKKDYGYYLKIVLNYFITQIGNEKMEELYIFKLKEIDEFCILDRIKYIVFLMKGKTIRIAKVSYRTVINRKYRGAKLNESNAN